MRFRGHVEPCADRRGFQGTPLALNQLVMQPWVRSLRIRSKLPLSLAEELEKVPAEARDWHWAQLIDASRKVVTSCGLRLNQHYPRSKQVFSQATPSA